MLIETLVSSQSGEQLSAAAAAVDEAHCSAVTTERDLKLAPRSGPLTAGQRHVD